MIKVKGGESQTSQHAASAMSKAFGGMVKKAVSGGEQPKGPAYEQVAIRAGKSFVESSESSSYSSSEKAPQPVDSGELKATKEEDSDFEFSDGEDDTLARIHQARLEQVRFTNVGRCFPSSFSLLYSSSIVLLFITSVSPFFHHT